MLALRSSPRTLRFKTFFASVAPPSRASRLKFINLRPEIDVRMRILLIGGNGFIGSPLLRELSNSGHQRAIFHRHAPSSSIDNSVVQIAGDRNHLPDYQKQIKQFAPDVVVDLILSSGEQARQLLDVCHGITRRVVAISSMDVYRAWDVLIGSEAGTLEPLPISEDSPVRTVRQLYPPETIKMLQGTFTWLDDHYDKVAVEETIRNDPRIPGTVVRLPMVYGPGDHLHRFFPLLKRITDKRPFVLLAEDFAAWKGPRGFVDNVAHAIALAATSDQAAGRVYNICEEPTLSELEWQKKIAHELDWKGTFVTLPKDRTPKHLLLPGNTAQHVVCSSARIRAELGYQELISLEDAIRRTAAWEMDYPPPINPQQFDYDAEDAAAAAAL